MNEKTGQMNHQTRIVPPASNTQAASTTAMTHEMEDRIMTELPRPIAQWIRYETTGDLCVRDIYRAWRLGAHTDTILASLRGAQRKQARQIYGSSHPQAALI
jgi:hypothetical protein